MVYSEIFANFKNKELLSGIRYVLLPLIFGKKIGYSEFRPYPCSSTDLDLFFLRKFVLMMCSAFIECSQEKTEHSIYLRGGEVAQCCFPYLKRFGLDVVNHSHLYTVVEKLLIATRSDFTQEAESILYELLDCLASDDIRLTSDECRKLRVCISFVLTSINMARLLFELYDFNGLVTSGDNWPPVNAMLTESRRLEVPSLCIQHGLDCEHWYMNEAIAQYYCVWGNERKKRYFSKSIYQPDEIFVTGNPLFDRFESPSSLSDPGNRWLLLTRPHSPEKCYEPSRYVNEGADVLSSILRILPDYPDVQLFIRLHPKDDPKPYLDLLLKCEENKRVSFSAVTQSLYGCIQRADLIFTEDSTSGMEAMLFEKPIIHVSACKAGPVLPFVEYGASYSGLCSEELEDSVSRLMFGFDCDAKAKMHKGQLDFLQDYCGDLDGKAGQRVASVIRSVV